MCDISVIIPIYNGETYIRDCLDSICNQTLENIEIICINDGSTDNSLSILNKYAAKDKRFKIISTENNGQGAARNIGLNVAKGDYIFFIDADDWIEFDTLKLLYSKAKSENLDLVFFQMINYIQNSNNYVETNLYNHQCFIDNGISEKLFFDFDDVNEFLFEIPVCPVSKLYKKEFLNKNNLKFPEGIFFEDNPFFYNSFFKCKKAGFLKKQLYYRRRHDDSVTQTFNRKKFDIVKATNKIIVVFKENDKYEPCKKQVINHTFSMLVEWFKKSPSNLKQEFYTIIKTEFMGFNELCEDFKNNLNDDYRLIHGIFLNNEYYLDFLSNYKLATVDYVIFDNGEEIMVNTKKYHKYKSNSINDYKISVVIPIYNNENIIHRTLMSIENQTFGHENIEVLMIDDSSNDRTYEIIKDYSNKYSGFKAIHINVGTGSPGTPRNIGLIESSAEYVIFLDHDDLFEINALSLLYDTILKFSCDVVYGTYVSIDRGSPTKIVYPNEKHGFFNNISENKRCIAFPPPSIWTKLFRKDFLIKNSILFPTILGEDAIFMSKVLLHAKGITYLWDSVICYHTLNDDSRTNNVDYDYLMEGFVSEEYLYNFYQNEGNIQLYKIRGEGILDFYLNQFYLSTLSKQEIINIFPLLYDFVNRLNFFNLTPHVYKHNEILFEYILNKDIYSILYFKGIINSKDIFLSKFKRVYGKVINRLFM